RRRRVPRRASPPRAPSQGRSRAGRPQEGVRPAAWGRCQGNPAGIATCFVGRAHDIHCSPRSVAFHSRLRRRADGARASERGGGEQAGGVGGAAVKRILHDGGARALGAFVALSILFFLAAAPALAEKRVALVIGNGAYKHAPALLNPKNDAEAMAAALKRMNFEVLTGVDLEKGPMERLLRDFVQKLGNADLALVFYAGHGLQV